MAKHYVNNKALLAELIRIRDASLGYTSELHNMMSLIADNLSLKFRYKREEDRQDCKAQAIMDCYMYYDRFDPKKSDNPFSFFTQVQKNAFAKGFKKIYPEEFRGKFVSISGYTWTI